MKLVIEYTNTSIRCEPINVVRFILFDKCEVTGHHQVVDIIEFTAEDFIPHRYLMYVLSKCKDFGAPPMDVAVYQYIVGAMGHHRLFVKEGMTDLFDVALTIAPYLCMMKAHHLGYKDDDGLINKATGRDLFKAFHEESEGGSTMEPYESAAYGYLA